MKQTGRISKSLTFEQFKALAERRPELNGEWVYRLTHYWMDKAATYPAFELSTDVYYFLSHDEAESFIKDQLVSHERNNIETYCFKIEQIPVGDLHFQTGDGWLYNHDGELIDSTITTWTENHHYLSRFFGRPDSRMRFKKGDIVEVFDDKAVKLAVVAADGPSVEWFWGLYNRCNSDDVEYYADSSDDCYYVLDGPGYLHHSHVSPLAMMRPRYPIPDDVKEFFAHCLAHADDDDCTECYNVEWIYPDSKGEYATTNIRIVFHPDERRHYLQMLTIQANSQHRRLIWERTVDRYKPWFSDVQGGKSRLWYIIREWNEIYRDEAKEPYLSPETPLTQLLYDPRKSIWTALQTSDSGL